MPNKLNGYTRYLATAITLFILLGGFITGYSTLKSNVSANTNDITKVQISQKEMASDMTQVKILLGKIEVQQDVMNKKIDEFSIKLDRLIEEK